MLVREVGVAQPLWLTAWLVLSSLNTEWPRDPKTLLMGTYLPRRTENSAQQKLVYSFMAAPFINTPPQEVLTDPQAEKRVAQPRNGVLFGRGKEWGTETVCSESKP